MNLLDILGYEFFKRDILLLNLFASFYAIYLQIPNIIPNLGLYNPSSYNNKLIDLFRRKCDIYQIHFY